MPSSSWSHSLSMSSVDENLFFFIFSVGFGFSYTHSIKRLVLIFFTIFIFIISLILNVIDSVGPYLFGYKIFSETSNNVFNSYKTNLASSFWISYVWIGIFVWQLAWLIYGISTIFRTSSSDYLYKYPPVMHWLVYVNFAIANILHLFCLFLWTQKLFALASFYSALMFVSLYIAVFVSLFKLSDYQREMYYTEKTNDVWFIRLLVQNGMFMYASWSFVMFLITLSITLVYQLDVPKQTAHLIIILLLLVKLIVYFVVENLIAYRYCKFIFSPWLIYALFLIDLILNPSLDIKPIRINKSLVLNELSSVVTSNSAYFFQIFLTAFFVFLFIIKLIKFIWSEFCYQKKFSHGF